MKVLTGFLSEIFPNKILVQHSIKNKHFNISSPLLGARDPSKPATMEFLAFEKFVTYAVAII